MAGALGKAAAMIGFPQAYLESKEVRETSSLVTELCRHFYTQGWVSGTGGSITMKVHDASIPKPEQLIVMSPSGVQKERMQPEDMYILSANGSIITSPSPKPYPNKAPKCTDCAPLFMKRVFLENMVMTSNSLRARRSVLVVYWFSFPLDGNLILEWTSGEYVDFANDYWQNRRLSLRKRLRKLGYKAYEMRNAGAVIHSHGMESCLVTMLNPQAKEFRITHMEMIKGIQGHGYYDELVVPIIENTAYENELTDSLTKAIEAYPKATAVLVRNHGVYIWGDSWIHAKTQAECYHYLFDAAIKLHQLGLDAATPDHGPIRSTIHSQNQISTKLSVKSGVKDSQNQTASPQRCIVLDIEGTTTPITFVTDVLFPYARQNVGKHLNLTYDTAETQEDIKLLRSQVEEDLRQGVADAVPIPHPDEGKEKVIAAMVSNVEAMIKADRKITALKELQGHIWRTGFECNELKSVIFEDVAEALEKWHSSGIKVYIYSSGSRLAQRLLFGNTNYGDLRKYLSGFFDTTIGNKKESRSYKEITETLGVDDPSEILFVTDVYLEATAAKAAGVEAIISIRPGNASLPENHGFKTVTSFSQI